jgi:T1SS-143 domain-containing protein
VVTGHITTDNGDLVPVSTAVTIAAGTTSATFNVSTLDDAYADSGEQFTASIASTSGGGYENLVVGTSSVTTTILDQTGSDNPPGAEDTATLSIAGAASVVEGESVTYTVSVDKAPATDLTVNVVTGHITTDNGDLVPVSTAVTIAAGTTSATFNVSTLDDAYADSGEQFTASIASTSGGGYENLVVGTSSVTTTILDQAGADNPPGAEDTATLSIAGAASVVEGEAVTYTVSVDKAPASDLTVNVVTGHITTDNGDLVPVSTAVTIAAGTTSATFNVSTLDDAYADSGEQFTASIASTSGGGYENLVVGTSSVTTTILDQTGSDNPPGAEDTATLSIAGAASVVEGEVVTYTVSVDKAPATDLTVNVVTGHITTDNGDLVPVSTAVTIAAGTTSATFNVSTLDDAYADSGEQFTASIASTSGGGYENLVVGTSSVTTTILDQTGSDNPPGPEDTVRAILTGVTSVAEGSDASYTIRLEDSNGNPVTVSENTRFTVRFANGSAEDADYQYANGATTIVTMPAGASTVTFPVSTVNDTLLEATEDFTVSLVAVADGGQFEHVALSGSVTTSIVDNDSMSVGNTVSDDDDVNENLDAVVANDITHAGVISNVAGDVTLSVDTAVAASLTSNGQPLSYVWDAGSRTLTASAGGTSVFTVTLNAANDGYVFRQLGAIDHAVVAGENHSLNIPLTLVASDAGGATIGTGSFIVTVSDDAPVVTGDYNIVTQNDGAYSESGFLSTAMVSNDVTTVSWNTSGLPQLVVDGSPVSYVDLGNGTLEGRLADGTVILRAVIDPTTVDANNRPHYSFEILQPVGSRLGFVDSETGYTTIGGGNVDGKSILFGGYLINDMLGYTGSGALSQVNTNQNWIGVGSGGGPGNWFDTGESLVMNFKDKLGDAGQMQSVGILVEGQGGAAYSLQWSVTVAMDAAGTQLATYSGTFSGAGNTDVSFDIPLMNGAVYFTQATITNVSGSFRLNFSGAVINNYFEDIPLDLAYTLTDADGDTASGAINALLTVDPQNAPPLAANDSASTPEDTPVSGNVLGNDADVDGDALTVTQFEVGGNTYAAGTVATLAGVGTLTIGANGDFSFTPVANYHGPVPVATYTITDGKATDNATLSLTVTPVNDAPTITAAAATVSEEGLAGGIADSTGVPADTTNSTVARGSMAIADVDGDALTVAIGAPATSLTSAGVPITWAGVGTDTLVGSAGGSEVIRVNVDASGNYTVTLSGPVDHANTSAEDVLDFSVNVTVSDGTTSTSAPLAIRVEDDAPTAISTVANVQVAVDQIVIQNLQAGWKNAVFDNYSSQYTRLQNTDADPLVDKVSWGRPASGSGQSGYTLVDNTAFTSATGTEVQAGQSFKLADFQHLNWPIYSGYATLDQVTLTLSLDVVINGTRNTISFDVLVDHNETPNSGADPRDIISLPAQTVTVTIGSQDYDIHLDGFRDGSGNIVNTIYTNENATNDFQIMGSIQSTDPVPSVSGNVFGDAGADGSVAGVVWGSTTSAYGTLTANADGSYAFVVDRAVKDGLSAGDSLSETFSYTITDKDGDTTTGSLTIQIGGYQNIDGTAGADTLVGTAADEYLSGYAGNDDISGGAGDDVLVGGQGDDLLAGGLGADVFRWELGDAGTAGNPARDTVTDFDTTANSDSLDLRDLLVGESQGVDQLGNLESYLHFEVSGSNTVVHVSSSGGFAGGYNPSATDQSITLNGVDLSLGGTLGSDQQVIQDLLSKGKLITD